MRKHYIDNLRILIIFLLFPVHTLMIWNDFGNKFYIWEEESRLLSTMIVIVNPWFMPILFALAGISARYALERRSTKEFVAERIKKLLVPFLCGMLLLVPIQTLYARKFFYGYRGGVAENLEYFFTHITDMSGYDGAFTPGHLWFILFLFIVSLVFLVVIHFFPYEKTEDKVSKMNVWMLIAMFISICVLYYIGNFGGFSLGRSFALYLLGYYILSNDDIIALLEKNLRLLTIIFLVAEIALVFAYYKFAYYGDMLVHFVAWMGILVILPMAKKYLNKSTAFTRYFGKASFAIYIFHQSILVTLAYYVVNCFDNIVLEILLIMFGSFLLTVLSYEIIRRIPYIRGAFGIKK